MLDSKHREHRGNACYSQFQQLCAASVFFAPRRTPTGRGDVKKHLRVLSNECRRLGLIVTNDLQNSRAIREQIQDLAIEGRALGEVLDKGDGLPRETEKARFDEITKTLIPNLKTKLAEAEDIENRMRALKEENNRKTEQENLNAILQVTNRPQLQLPVNGRQPVDDQPVIAHVKCAKLKAFKNERDAYNAGMYLRVINGREVGREDVHALQQCQRNGLIVSNTQLERSGPEGGYMVPAPLSSTLIDVRERVGIARQVCDVQPMTSDTLSFPKRAGGMTVYYPDEAATITTSDPTKAQIMTVARKRAVAGEVSQELVDDALISVADNTFSEMGYALALKEDEEFIDGTGAASYGSVRGLKNRIGAGGVSTAATGHDTWGELDLADVSAWLGLLPDRFDRMPSIICSRAFYWNVLLRLEMAAGGNAIQSLQAGDGGRRFFAGYPVYFSHFMPTSTAAATVCAFFGDFAQGVILGDRMGIRMSRDDSAGFLRDVVTFRATSRYDINIHEPGTASAPGAYVALKTAS